MGINKKMNPLRNPVAKLLKDTLKGSGRVISGEYNGKRFLTNGTFLTIFTSESDWKEILLECKLEPRNGVYSFGSWADNVPDIAPIMGQADKAIECKYLEATLYLNNTHYHLFAANGAIYAFDEQFMALWEGFSVKQNKQMLKASDSRYTSIILAVRNMKNRDNSWNEEVKKLVESLQAPV